MKKLILTLPLSALISISTFANDVTVEPEPTTTEQKVYRSKELNDYIECKEKEREGVPVSSLKDSLEIIEQKEEVANVAFVIVSLEQLRPQASIAEIQKKFPELDTRTARILAAQRQQGSLMQLAGGPRNAVSPCVDLLLPKLEIDGFFIGKLYKIEPTPKEMLKDEFRYFDFKQIEKNNKLLRELLKRSDKRQNRGL